MTSLAYGDASGLPAHCHCCGASLADSASGPYPGTGQAGIVLVGIRNCPSCGHGTASPLPTEEALAALYTQQQYWRGQVRIDRRSGAVLFALAGVRWKMIRAALPDGLRPRLLDLGSGHGCLGLVAAAQLAHYTAVEPDARLRAALSEVWPVQAGAPSLLTAASLEEAPGEFEAIALSHVLEHVREPAELLLAALARLAPGGLLFVDVPLRDDRFKPDVFPHLQFFTVQSLARLLQGLGLTLLEAAAWGRSPQDGPLVERPAAAARLRGRLVQVAKRLLPGQIVTWIMSWHLGAGRRSTDGVWIRALARKAAP